MEERKLTDKQKQAILAHTLAAMGSLRGMPASWRPPKTEKPKALQPVTVEAITETPTVDALVAAAKAEERRAKLQQARADREAQQAIERLARERRIVEHQKRVESARAALLQRRRGHNGRGREWAVSRGAEPAVEVPVQTVQEMAVPDAAKGIFQGHPLYVPYREWLKRMNYKASRKSARLFLAIFKERLSATHQQASTSEASGQAQG